jgi:protocatechuate 3,4-dioxygenase beta subunit
LALLNASGTPSNSLTGAAPLTVKVTVLDANKKPVPNSVVSFATNNTLAVFSPTSGTALTDANGVANVSMRAANLAAGGAGTVTASSTVGTTTASGKVNYAVSATMLTFGTLSASPASLQAYGSTVLSVDLMNGASKYTDQQVNVTFSSACAIAGKATLATTAPTNNGTAQTVYRDKGCANNDVVTVTADGVAKPATATLTIAPPAAASVQFAQALPSDKSIVIKSQGGNGRTETATLTFKVVDIFGNPLPGRQVNFSRVPVDADVVINKSTDTSDPEGNVITTVNSGATPTSFRVLATLPSTGNGGANISTLSDTVVVTTGLPVKRSFSISTTSFNVEGWNIDSSPTNPAAHIQVMLADDFSNPVPDGTPIVFQTNLGSIGSSSRGGCNTLNGGCSADFRAQEPRIAQQNIPATPCNTGHEGSKPDLLRPGMATICASTTDGANTMFGKIAVFLSGSHPVNTTMNGTLLSPSAPNDLGSTSVKTGKVFQLQINDLNNNPMPQGTKVELVSIVNASAVDVLPATVPNIAPHGNGGDDMTGNIASGPQGSIHTFGVYPAGPDCAWAGPASFYVQITTPRGTVTAIPFKVLFTCP